MNFKNRRAIAQSVGKCQSKAWDEYGHSATTSDWKIVLFIGVSHRDLDVHTHTNAHVDSFGIYYLFLLLRLLLNRRRMLSSPPISSLKLHWMFSREHARYARILFWHKGKPIRDPNLFSFIISPILNYYNRACAWPKTNFIHSCLKNDTTSCTYSII